jgi:hypothetical protein
VFSRTFHPATCFREFVGRRVFSAITEESRMKEQERERGGGGGGREIRDTESESERDRKTDSERGASEREREMESQRDGEQGDALSSAHCNSHYSWRASKERKRNMTVVFFAMVVFS